MTKQEISQRIAAVCRTLDGGITVTGVQNAANLAGCFNILQEIYQDLQIEEAKTKKKPVQAE